MDAGDRPRPLNGMRVVIARAPARIDFGGGWTDVPPYDVEQGGCVCNLAISRHVSVSVAPSAGGIEVDQDGVVARADTAADLPRDGSAALAAAALRRTGVGDVRVAVRSHFPSGAGLGGSSAAGVALLGALLAWKGETASRDAIAEMSRAVEVGELGVAGGRQDHYAAAFGGALGLWFDGPVRVRQLPLPEALARELERRCIVAYTGRSRISGDTITAVLDGYAARDPGVTDALRHIRTLAEEMVGTLERGDLDAMGALVGEHWTHQRRLHPRITTPEIDTVLDAAARAGALGGKALGASGGGCVLVVAGADSVARVRAAVARHAELVPFSVDRAGLLTRTLEIR